MTIAVVASAGNPAAQSLVAAWQDRGAALLTPRDLSRPGWRHSVTNPGSGRLAIDERQLSVSALYGVVSMLDMVAPDDLPHVAAWDRGYVAAEMRAFLLAWLSTIPVKVLNRPTPLSLAGCGWSREQWLLAARALGIPTFTLDWPLAGVSAPAAAATVVRIGTETVGEVDAELADWTGRLAERGGATAIAARFSAEPRRLLSVSVIPDYTRPAVADAALRWFDGP